MGNKRGQKIESQLQKTLARAPADRAAFPAEAGAEDQELGLEAKTLISNEQQVKTLVETAVLEDANHQAGLAAGRLIGPYQILQPLGKGGMAEIYLARDTRLGRRVALKLLPASFTSDEDRLRRFRQEARAASTLNHPNILTIHEIGELAGIHFIATEFIEGETLRQHLKKRRLELGEAIDIVVQVATALAAAHQAGIIHRDIKPENIMLRPDGYTKVLDFGLAKLTERQIAADTAAITIERIDTDPGTVMGTVYYMSPEQARGLAVDEKTDIFSLGVMLYEMVAGRRPFEGETSSHIIVSILEKEPPALSVYWPETPTELQSIVSKALCKDRRKRYQKIEELLVDLKNLKQLVGVEMSHALRSNGSSAKSTKSVKSRSSKPASQRRRSSKIINSLAILPLENTSADPNTEYLSDGITESIINNLSQLPKLKVMARSTVFRYKGKDIDPQQVGQALGVRAVLTGRVNQLGDTLILAVELVDVGDGSQLWGEQYNRKLTDILLLQTDISREISENLRLKLSGAEQQQLTKRYTNNTEAYQLYLKGRYHWNKRTEADLKKSIDYFQQAIRIDPGYALAYAGLADAYAIMGDAGYAFMRPKEAFLEAKLAVLKALQLDDTMAEAQASLGHIQMHNYEWLDAEKALKRALELNPNYIQAYHWYSFYLIFMGRHDEAMNNIARALELDSLSLPTNTALGDVLYYSDRYDQAIKQFQKVLDMDQQFLQAHSVLAKAYEQKQMYEEAMAEHQKVTMIAKDNMEFLASMGHTYAVSGKRSEALKVLAELKEQSSQRYISSYTIGLLYTGLGDKDQAFKWLNKACEEHDAWVIFLTVDPRLHSLRSDWQYEALARRAGFSHFTTENG